MKVLLDSCVWNGAVNELQEAGHDVLWVGDWYQDPGDEEIITYSYNDGRVLITLDKDFGELAIVHGMPHCGIIRLVNFSIRDQATVCKYILSIYEKELKARSIITAEKNRVRIRPPYIN